MARSRVGSPHSAALGFGTGSGGAGSRPFAIWKHDDIWLGQIRRHLSAKQALPVRPVSTPPTNRTGNEELGSQRKKRERL